MDSSVKLSVQRFALYLTMLCSYLLDDGPDVTHTYRGMVLQPHVVPQAYIQCLKHKTLSKEGRKTFDVLDNVVFVKFVGHVLFQNGVLERQASLK